MLGIIIGVAAVIVIMAVGAGAQSLILNQVKSLGANLIGIMPGATEKDGPPASVMGINITTLTYEDARALLDKKKNSHLLDLVAYTKSIGLVSWQSNQYSTNLSGCTAGYPAVEGGEVEAGRFFTSEEERNLSRVAVLGSTAKRELFGDNPALGEKIKIRRHVFEVIGVMAERGKVAMQDYDDQVFLPLKTMQKLIAGVDHLGLIRAKVDNAQNLNQAMADMTAILRERHGIIDQSGATDDFSVRSAAEAVDMITQVTDGLRFFLAAMAALSLVVGGIGIMNIMLINVAERTREIGLRQALGATRLDIFRQFIFEAVAITFAGGAIGAAIGILISFLAALAIGHFGYQWDFIVSGYSIVLALAVTSLTGLVFGFYPAAKASRLEPVAALRHE